MLSIKKTYHNIIVLLLFIFMNVLVNGQDCGDEKINNAQKKYDIGLFQEIETYLMPCIIDGFNILQKEKAYKLIAISNLAIDSLSACIKASENLLKIKPYFEPDLFDPPKFIEIINNLKKIEQKQIITSVSKKAENVLEAPATVLIITEQEIIDRGYHDIEEIFHDIPGFEISKGRGANYSNLYQRGYRSVLTDRTILLIDGVEQNDLTSDNAPISRQYPLSNIKRVEIIYGPSSTMYGANAFVGVVNIVTKLNEDICEKRDIGINLNSAYSSMNTKYIDAVIGIKKKKISFSLTGRYYNTNGMDLTSFDSWDFNQDNIDYYSVMNITGVNDKGNFVAEDYINNTRIDTLPANNLYQINYNSTGDATDILLTEEGKSRAYSFDNMALNPNPGKNRVKMDPSQEDWYLKGKMQLSNFTFAIESWRSDEGSAAWYSDKSFLFRQNYMRWVNWNSCFYVNYEKQLNDSLFISNITSYRLHTVNGNTNYETFNGYFNGYSFLELAIDKEPVLTTKYYYRTSNQIRNETKINWTPLSWLDILSGIEFRSGLIQGDYLKSTEVNPDETGTISGNIFGTDHFRSFDLGVYTQLKAKVENFNFILGGRLDYNKIRQNGGYGTVFNPRLAIVYSQGDFIIKTIYATAFKDASYLEKYGTVAGRDISNPTLEPEKAQNIEVSTFWKTNKYLSFDVSTFYSLYSNVVGLADVELENGTTTGQFQAIGEQTIYGLQSNLKFNISNYHFWANYTFLNPTDKETDLRISDIASHHINAGINAFYFKKLNINVRSNFVGERLTGEGTSGSLNENTSIDPYVILHLMIGYEEVFKGLRVQLGVQNIFNTQYLDPGVRTATEPFAPVIPQAGRTYSIKLIYKY
ncbi:MAG: TonB-dependent receptor plug domain-containing protein [Salinivirgaceae bacterium]|nr:TonB-dependent receptor plug domain-containing protein [Salinivirgaceae bacterium]